MGRGRSKKVRWERTYGRYHCKKCNKRWESAYTFNIEPSERSWWQALSLIEGTLTVLFRQKCRECNQGVFPYRTDLLTCSLCECRPCECSDSERDRQHVDPKKRHRSDLCEKCLKGYPCFRDDEDD